MKILTRLVGSWFLLSAMLIYGQDPPVREITRVSGDLYRASEGNWRTVFLVTSEGIVLGDPLNTSFAAWLAEELENRFAVPVRYVIYSHSHWDHIEGGRQFEDTAIFIGQEGMLRNMDGRFPHMPGGFTDDNNNGMFEREEVRDRNAFPDYSGVCGSRFFDRHDVNGDGHVTPAEHFADVRPPDIVYAERMVITLGGQRVELIHPGKNHANDGTVMFFPAQRAVFSVDFPADALVSTTMRSLPSACGNFDFHPLSEWIRSYHSIEALDFDILVQSHGSVLFSKQDLREGRQFFEDLRDAVSAGMAEGLSLDELKATVLLPDYADWRLYERLREDNVESAYYNLKLYR